jgi:hypothetical protein
MAGSRDSIFKCSCIKCLSFCIRLQCVPQCATHNAAMPGTRICIKQTLIPQKKVAEPIRIGGETCIPRCDWSSVGAENRVVSGSRPD